MILSGLNDDLSGLVVLRERSLRVPNKKRLFRGVKFADDVVPVKMFEQGVMSPGLGKAHGNLELARKTFERVFGTYSPILALLYTWEYDARSLEYGLGVSTTEYLAIARTMGNYILEIAVDETKIANVTVGRTGFHADKREVDAYRCPQDFDTFMEREYTFLNGIKRGNIRRLYKRGS